LPLQWQRAAQRAQIREVILLPFADHLRVEFGGKAEAALLRDVEQIQPASTRAKFTSIVQGRARLHLDKRGRFSIPERLRRGPPLLGRELVLCGVLKAAEIWMADLWEQNSSNGLEEYQRAATQIGL
jgi:DNA-binding transcriptional regulator/RsmH inhibitor MraZ